MLISQQTLLKFQLWNLKLLCWFEKLICICNTEKYGFFYFQINTFQFLATHHNFLYTGLCSHWKSDIWQKLCVCVQTAAWKVKSGLDFALTSLWAGQFTFGRQLSYLRARPDERSGLQFMCIQITGPGLSLPFQDQNIDNRNGCAQSWLWSSNCL